MTLLTTFFFHSSFLPLPDYDQHGRKVIVMRPGCYDPFRHKPEDIEKANFMISDVMVLEDEQLFVTGMVIIYDCEGFTMNHFTQRPLSMTKKHMYYLQVLQIKIYNGPIN